MGLTFAALCLSSLTHSIDVTNFDTFDTSSFDATDPENPDIFQTLKAFIPLTLLGGVYQNMIPYSMKLIKDDLSSSSSGSSSGTRKEDEVNKWSKILIAVGSAVPTAMFVSWCTISNGSDVTGKNLNDRHTIHVPSNSNTNLA
ncbi:hypothetical protein TL16_g11906 [Triparma laevis f. inornata]|uniref:Uncharacterized protein n=2 Tax=Triparma laevis TaxID=1534972 RepID=A0A9W7E5Y5_9STRA|nr:hypothetical protein TrLO_g1411 [Triparma laevis f. longispina]GMH90913.1 hypothetical protein TL16_g11906 [Triparma laevis f. inornata]